jgi:hypothetical protein
MFTHMMMFHLLIIHSCYEGSIVANENVAITKHNRLNPPVRKSRNMHGVCCHVCHRAWCQGMCQEMKQMNLLQKCCTENEVISMLQFFGDSIILTNICHFYGNQLYPVYGRSFPLSLRRQCLHIHQWENHEICTESVVTFVIELGVKVCVKKWSRWICFCYIMFFMYHVTNTRCASLPIGEEH